MDDWKTTFLLGRPILKGYVSFREGNVQKRTCFCGFVESEELQRPWIPYGFPCYPCDSVGRSGQMCHPRCLTHWRVFKYGFWILRISLYTKQINSIISHQKNQEWFKFLENDFSEEQVPHQPSVNCVERSIPQTMPSQRAPAKMNKQHLRNILAFKLQPFTVHVYINYVSWWTMMNNDERSRQYN